jgi:hypothetical protein
MSIYRSPILGGLMNDDYSSRPATIGIPVFPTSAAPVALTQ